MIWSIVLSHFNRCGCHRFRTDLNVIGRVVVVSDRHPRSKIEDPAVGSAEADKPKRRRTRHDYRPERPKHTSPGHRPGEPWIKKKKSPERALHPRQAWKPICQLSVPGLGLLSSGVSRSSPFLTSFSYRVDRSRLLASAKSSFFLFFVLTI